jgi:hypothetical protein
MVSLGLGQRSRAYTYQYALSAGNHLRIETSIRHLKVSELEVILEQKKRQGVVVGAQLVWWWWWVHS